MNNIDKFVELVHECNNIVFFGGAGVSTESGIPDFRSPDGLYKQNIDGLHQKAGSSNVIELHGSVLRNYCERCHKFYGIDKIINSEGVPMCDCGGRIKPDVVLYEEGLDDNNITNAVNYIRHADMLIIGGTSLGVYPAAGLIDYYRGDKLVLINKSATPYDNRADILINAPLADVFKNFM